MARPTKYDPKFCEELVKHMAKGLSFEAFAGAIGVTKATLYNWEKDFPEFLDAKGIGWEKARIFWEELGIDNIINRSDSVSHGKEGGESSSRSLNASVWIFNMKNRFPAEWRDRTEVKSDVDAKVEVSGGLSIDLQERVKQLKGEE